MKIVQFMLYKLQGQLKQNRQQLFMLQQKVLEISRSVYKYRISSFKHFDLENHADHIWLESFLLFSFVLDTFHTLQTQTQKIYEVVHLCANHHVQLASMKAALNTHTVRPW